MSDLDVFKKLADFIREHENYIAKHVQLGKENFSNNQILRDSIAFRILLVCNIYRNFSAKNIQGFSDIQGKAQQIQDWLLKGMFSTDELWIVTRREYREVFDWLNKYFISLGIVDPEEDKHARKEAAKAFLFAMSSGESTSPDTDAAKSFFHDIHAGEPPDASD